MWNISNDTMGIFLFDFVIYQKCLLNEKTDLKSIPILAKYKYK